MATHAEIIMTMEIITEQLDLLTVKVEQLEQCLRKPMLRP